MQQRAANAKKSNAQLLLEFTSKQREFFETALRPDISYPLFGGSIRSGKAQPLTEPVCTPHGFRPMGEIRKGSLVCDAFGGLSRVIAVHSQGRKQIYKVTMADGGMTRCCGDHLWVGHFAIKGNRGDRVFSTLDILGKIDASNFCIAPTKPVAFTMPPPGRTGTGLKIDPYLLGVILGDGSTANGSIRISNPDAEIRQRIDSIPGVRTRSQAVENTYSIGDDGHTIIAALRSMGLWRKLSHEKFIPKEYLFAHTKDRIAIVQGLLDTDGTVGKRGHTSFCSTSKTMAEQVRWLIHSLGGWCTMTSKEPFYTKNGDRVHCKTAYILYIGHPRADELFHLPRKAARARELKSTYFQTQRKIVSIEPDGVEEAQCITIDHPSGMYVTRDFIPTHNSAVAILTIIILAKIYPRSRWAIVRKDLPTLRRNTLPTFEQLKPRNFCGEVNRSSWNCHCVNGSEILFFSESIKLDPDLDRWKGLEVNGFALEEVNELNELSFNKAIERAGSWLCRDSNGQVLEQPKPLILMTCNPARNWVKRLIYDPWSRGELAPPFFFLPATVEDNPHLTDEYRQSLRNMEQTSPAAYRRFVLGDWSVADEPDQLISMEWIIDARNVQPERDKKGLGVDVARYGNDDTVLAHRNGNVLERLEYFRDLSVDRVSDIVQARLQQGPIDADRCHIDTVGLGAGVYDNLRKAGWKCIELISGAKPIERRGDDRTSYRFRNLRSQIWWEFRERLRNGEVSIEIDDPRLFEDLTAPRYSMTGDKVIAVESKDEIHKRIGRSTDAGDAVVYAFAELHKPRNFAMSINSDSNGVTLTRPSYWRNI